jgi:hypothetical protein
VCATALLVRHGFKSHTIHQVLRVSARDLLYKHMKPCKILIFGDSFAADWTVKYPNMLGWPNMLGKAFDVTNMAQAGVSEYKIYQQVMTVSDLDQYDFFLISHTSPYRSVTRRHPVHCQDPLHKNADLIMSDIDYHSSRWRNIFNFSLNAATEYFRHHYDDEFHETIYGLFRKSINERLPQDQVIVCNNFITPAAHRELHFCDFSEIQKQHPGLINHVSTKGNELICQQLCDYIRKI